MRRVPAWRIVFLVLTVIGACLSADLERLHVRVHTDPHYHSYCAMSERVNCETVATSSYSVFFGLPVALWGLFSYLLMFGLTIWGLRTNVPTPAWPFGSLFALTLFASVVNIFLFGISHFVIESVCIVCVGTYFTGFAMLGAAWIELKRHGVGPIQALLDELGAVKKSPRPAFLFAGFFAVALIGCWVCVPRYWQIQTSQGPGGLSVGHNEDGHPWIGATEPKVEIIEFSDYQCPHCSRGHEQIRQYVEQHADVVRLTHLHYPLDHHCNPTVTKPYHLHACLYARMAVCADAQGKFWQMNDVLFARGREHTALSVAALKTEMEMDWPEFEACLEDKKTQALVTKDIQAGRALNIRGTPTFVLGDELFPGRIPQDVLHKKLRVVENVDHKTSNGQAK